MANLLPTRVRRNVGYALAQWTKVDKFSGGMRIENIWAVLVAIVNSQQGEGGKNLMALQG
jgi:hypothetical protein